MSKSISEDCPAQPKRIVICCDGTWQSATGLDRKTGAASNVAKLCQILASAGTEKGKEYQQVVYYDAGVGTGDIGWVQAAIQGGSGSGLLENVIEAYNYIVNNFTKGDQLYFFGFSRGAFTARSTAGLVNEVGVIRPSAMRKFIHLYSAYVTKADFKVPFGLSKEWKDFLVAEPDAVLVPRGEQEIKVIGVWDTVGALGVPAMGHIWRREHTKSREPFQFHDVTLNSKVQHAFQALALDDQRDSFHPTVWKLHPSHNDESKPHPEDNDVTELVQCWFPGAHINVGGGSSSSAGEGDFKEQLASITYTWMLDLIRAHLAFDPVELKAQKEDWEAALKANTSDMIAEKQDEENDRNMVAKGFAALQSIVTGGKKEGEHGFAMEDIPDSHSALYDILGKPVDRIPQNLTKADFDAGWRTNESVHYAVHARQEKRKDYVPHALKGWTRRQNAQGSWEWVSSKDGHKVLPESTPGNGLERKYSMEYWLADKAGVTL